MLLTSLPFILFSQEKALNKAVKNGKNATNLTYFVEFQKYYEMDDVSKWMTEKGYNILQSSTAEFPVFGDTKVGYDKVYFMTSSDYAVFQQTLERIAAEERKKNQTVSVDWTDLILAAVVVTTGVIIYKGTEYAIENGALSNTSSSSSSSPSVCYYPETEKSTGGEEEAAGKKWKVFEVKCGNGTLPSFFFQGEKGTLNPYVGYYKPKFSAGDEYLGETKGEAMKKLCNCSN